MRTFNALATNALLTVAAVSSIIGLAMSRTNRGFELKNVAAASAEKEEIQWGEERGKSKLGKIIGKMKAFDKHVKLFFERKY